MLELIGIWLAAQAVCGLRTARSDGTCVVQYMVILVVALACSDENRPRRILGAETLRWLAVELGAMGLLAPGC